VPAEGGHDPVFAVDCLKPLCYIERTLYILPHQEK
jgi:hypothetical protein